MTVHGLTGLAGSLGSPALACGARSPRRSSEGAPDRADEGSSSRHGGCGMAQESTAEALAGLGHGTATDTLRSAPTTERRRTSQSQAMRKPRHIKGTGSIFTRPGSPYLYVSYWNGKRQVKESAKTTDEQVAQALLDKRREQMRTRRHVDPRKQERITVDELLNALQEHY